jgi:hypothetical protein
MNFKFKKNDVLIKVPKPENEFLIDKIRIVGYTDSDYLVFNYFSQANHIIFKEVVETRFIKLTRLAKYFYE